MFFKQTGVALSECLGAPGAKPLARVFVLLLAWTLALLSHNALAADRRIAFVIGNASYASEAPLANPHRDARLLADVLRKDLGFTEVIEKRDLTRAQLFDLVEEVGRKSRGADAVVVYYSGHGMRAAGGNYLIPVDARISEESHVRRDGIAAADLADVMRDSGARVALLVLDACRNNPYSVRTRGTAKGLARMNISGGNVLVAYATSENATADDGAPGNSPYALALAQQLRDRNKSLLAQFDGVRRQVRDVTGGKQNPTREGDLEVDVFLVPGTGLQPAAPRVGVPVTTSVPPAPAAAGSTVAGTCPGCPKLTVLLATPGDSRPRESVQIFLSRLRKAFATELIVRSALGPQERAEVSVQRGAYILLIDATDGSAEHNWTAELKDDSGRRLKGSQFLARDMGAGVLGNFLLDWTCKALPQPCVNAPRYDLGVERQGERYALILTDTSGTRQVALASPKPILSPVELSPNGQLAYISLESGKPAVWIHKIGAGTRKQILVEDGLTGLRWTDAGLVGYVGESPKLRFSAEQLALD